MALKPSNFQSFTSMADQASPFQEANAASSNGRLFKGVTIIKAGLGNKRDRHLYTPKALQEAVRTGLFNDLDAYVDHPTSIDEQVQPERSVLDRAGVYRNPRYIEENNGGRVVADLHVLETHAGLASGIRELMGMGLGHKMGVSIIGSGQTTPTKHREANGDEMDVQRVDKFVKLRSADFVTQAGAGGGFSNLLESAREAALEQNDMDPQAIIAQITEANAAGKFEEAETLTAQLAEAFKKKKKPANDAADAEDEADGGADETTEGSACDKTMEAEKPADETKVADEAADEDAEATSSDEDADEDTEEADADPVEDAETTTEPVKEALPGKGNKQGSLTKKAGKRKPFGQKFAKESDAPDADLRAMVDTLREQVATLKGKLDAKDLQTYTGKKVRESKLPEKAKAKLMGKLGKMTERAAIDAEVAFQEGFYSELKADAGLSKFEEVEGAGGSTHEGIGSTDNGVDSFREAVTGSGLKLKAVK